MTSPQSDLSIVQTKFFTEQLNRLAYVTIYRLCQVVHDVKVPLESLLIATRDWEKDTDLEWLQIDMGEHGELK